MKKIFLLLGFLALSMPCLLAQRLVKITPLTRVCAVEGDAAPKNRYVLDPDIEAQKTIDDICRKIGVSSKNIILEAANVPNAEALIIDGKRYIHYNPLYINKIQKESKTYWSMIFVLAHEIGHHVNFHTLDSADMEKRQLEELDADKTAGCALAHLGAPREELEKITNALNETGDKSHPPRSARLLFVMRGWKECASKPPVSEPPPPIIQPNSNQECAKNNTGDVYFKNMTKRTVRVHLSPQLGYYEQSKFITIGLDETKGFLDLKAGKQLFVIRIQSQDALGSFGFDDYKNEAIRIQTCADQSQPAIVIQ